MKKQHKTQHQNQQQKHNAGQSSRSHLQAPLAPPGQASPHHFQPTAGFVDFASSSPVPMLANHEQLGRRMHLQQQHQQQQEALFTSTIWTPHLRQPYQPPLFSHPPPPPATFMPTNYENNLNDFSTLQQATQATKRQQTPDYASNGQLFYGIIVSLSILLSMVLVIILLLGNHASNYHYRLTRLPVNKLNSLRNWLAQRNLASSAGGISGRGCLHHRHLHASECMKCNRAASSPDESSASHWPIVNGLASSTTSNSSGILGTLRGPQLHQAPTSSSIIVGLNPIARLNGQHGHNKTISNHIKQQFCFTTQASKVSTVMDNYGMGPASSLGGNGGGGSNRGYYSVLNYSDGDDNFAPAAYRHQPPTADLLGTGYQCQQQQQQHQQQQQSQKQVQNFATPNSAYHQFATLGHNNQTTRLIWQQSPPNGSGGINMNLAEPNNASYLIDGGAYMPLSSNSSGNAPANAHSGSGSPIYQTIYG